MKQVIKALGVASAVILARFLLLSPIIGSWCSAFSCSTIVAPVIASQCGFWWLISFLISPKILVTPLWLFLLRRMPLFCAARIFQKGENFLTIGISVVCMAMFVMHPIGAQAWPYALYWIIPIILFKYNNAVFVRALQASFVAHGVGSVIYLYTSTIAAHVWLGLIPVVACERLLIAIGIVICNELYEICIRFVVSYKNRIVGCKVIE